MKYKNQFSFILNWIWKTSVHNTPIGTDFVIQDFYLFGVEEVLPKVNQCPHFVGKIQLFLFYTFVTEPLESLTQMSSFYLSQIRIWFCCESPWYVYVLIYIYQNVCVVIQYRNTAFTHRTFRCIECSSVFDEKYTLWTFTF